MATYSMIATADLHLHPWRLCSRDDGQDRLQDGLNATRASLALARQMGAPWICAGDVKQPKDHWLVRVQNALLALLDEFRDVEKIFVSGQHDGVDGDDKSGLQFLTRVPRTRVYDSPTIDTTPVGRGKMLVWPAMSDPATLPDWLRRAKQEGCWMVLGHAFLRESLVGPANVRLSGVYTMHEFGLAPSLPIFRFGLFGDIHKLQCLPRANARAAQVWYPGSPYAQNWGELEPQRGCLVITGNNDEPTVSLWPVSGPRYLVEDWSAATTASVQARVATGLPEFRGNFVALLVGDQVDASALDRVRAAAQARYLQVTLASKPPEAQPVPPIHTGLSRDEMLRQYVAACPPTELNAEALVLAGLQLLVED